MSPGTVFAAAVFVPRPPSTKTKISEQGTAGGQLEKALDEVPAEGRPEFGNALKAIQLAQERVDSALETVGHSGFND